MVHDNELHQTLQIQHLLMGKTILCYVLFFEITLGIKYHFVNASFNHNI